VVSFVRFPAVATLNSPVDAGSSFNCTIAQITQFPNYSITKSLPFSGFLEFADFAFHQVAFQGAYVADVELAVQVIGLVEEGAG
jgi:hypothetical protein